ncbi:MAG: hypothetical protein HRT69_14140 [Flavobacteriaceae bacterium]|nr:hypothetical protein [Flavobacteriaceae bacterium]
MKIKFILFLFWNFIIHSTFSQVGINTTSPEGALDVSSSTTGFVPPRVQLTSTLLEAPVVNPQTGSIPAGTIVWNIASAGTVPNDVGPGLYYWDGSRWISFAGSPGGIDWSISGNYGTNTTSNYIGTNDDNGFVVKTNATNRFLYGNAGGLYSYEDGAAATPAYSWNDNKDLGIYRKGADTLAFSTVGLERMYIEERGRVSVNGANTNQGVLNATSLTAGTAWNKVFSAIQGVNNEDYGAGLWGKTSSATGYGVYGYAWKFDGIGVFGYNNKKGIGVYGKNDGGGIGVKGEFTGNAVTGTAIGVNGISSRTNGYGVLGENTAFSAGGSAEYGVYSNGDSGATGVKTFRIDHPLDPENKYLVHFSIESNEVLNIYRGKATFNEEGNTTVTLPNYYKVINKDASYQLTPIGAAMPNLFISKEISQNTFVISGGVAGKKVSWQITAQRNDLYVQRKKPQVEVEKTEFEKGKYLIPELYNQPKEKGVFYSNKKIKVNNINN